jgi:hypothetical protein
MSFAGMLCRREFSMDARVEPAHDELRETC